MAADVAPGPGGDRFAGLLPAELVPFFDDRFALSCTLFEEYVHRLALRVVRETGLGAAAQDPGTPAAIAARAGLDATRMADVVQWLLVTLALGGRATQVGDGQFRVAGALPDLDP